MAKKTETAPIYVQRKGVGLWPEMQIDADAIARLPYGERIKVTLSTARSPKRLRFWWSFLHKVVDATGCSPTAESLNDVIKLHTGFVTPVMIKGMTVMVPRSISYSSMSEQDFDAYVHNGIRFVAENYELIPEDVFGSERIE